ncbi:MAG: Hsp33 family molecular chaperone HslO [Desulfobacca sp.]|uniref:Hsp33 family molecular chaperone HslO n=1 Tax=Desulfobacca sp. TaxID=2067990 RepID=UPI00404B32EB
MIDYLVRSITADGSIRGLAVVSTGLVEEARQRQDAWPTAAAALGRALTGGLLLGALLKTGQRLAIKIEGDGPLKKILVEAESNGAVRGYVARPHVHLPPRNGKLDVAGAVGRTGVLTVSQDLRLKEPYTGIVQLVSGEIAEDLAYYLVESAQIPSALALGVYVAADGRVTAAGGFLIQTLPPVQEKVLEQLIHRIRALPPVTDLLRQGRTPEDILAAIYGQLPYRILEKFAVAWQCSCSRERVERALLTLGTATLQEMAGQEEVTTVTCEFCGQEYRFSSIELCQLAGETPL